MKETNENDRYAKHEREKQKEEVDNILKQHQHQFNLLIEHEFHPNMFHTYSEFDVNKYLPKDDGYINSKIMRKYKNYLNKKKENVYKEEKNNNNNNVFQNNNNNNSISDIQSELLFDEYSNIDYNNFKLTDINASNNNKQNDISFNLVDDSVLKSNLNENNDDLIFQFHKSFFQVYFENVPYEEHITDNVNENSNNKYMNQYNRHNEILEFNMKHSSKQEHFKFNVNNNYQWYCLDYPIGNESDEFVDKFLLFEI